MLGKIVDYDGETLTIIVPNFYDYHILEKQNITECEVVLNDGRNLSPKQQLAIILTVRDITRFICGYEEKDYVRQEMLRTLQLNYLIDVSPEDVRFQLTARYCDLVGVEFFSLSAKKENCASVTLASGFLSWLIDLCIENAIPCSSSLLDRAEDIQRYLYACVMNRRCAICGKRGEIHHFDHTVGMGRNRKEIVHEGMEVVCLCREHHTEAHASGKKSFREKHHICGIVLDAEMCKTLKLKAKG